MSFRSLWLEQPEAPYAYTQGVGIGQATYLLSLTATLGSLSLASNIQVVLPGSLSVVTTLGALTLSAGIAQSVLYTKAVFDLVNAGLNVIVNRVPSNVVPYDYVIAWEPPVGTVLPLWSEVTLTVSDGPVTPAPLTSAIPSVTGLTTSQAVAAIGNANFSLDQYTWAIDSSDAGTVIGQSPAGGTLAVPGTVITLTVSLGPTSTDQTVPVPA